MPTDPDSDPIVCRMTMRIVGDRLIIAKRREKKYGNQKTVYVNTITIIVRVDRGSRATMFHCLHKDLHIQSTNISLINRRGSRVVLW